MRLFWWEEGRPMSILLAHPLVPVRKLCVIPVPPLAVDTRRAIPEVEGDVNGWALFDMHTLRWRV